MEIPDHVLDTLLGSMASSPLVDDSEIESEKEQATNPKVRKPIELKENPLIIGTITALFSKDNVHRALVQTVHNDIDDGYYFRVDATGKVFASHRVAINNARNWLRKQRLKYYRRNPDKKPVLKTVRLIPKKVKSKIREINKLYKMKSDTAIILHRMSEKKLKLHLNYSRKKWENKKTTAVSGTTTEFNTAIYNVMEDGTKKERKKVAKMLKKFTHEPFRNTNMFY